MKKTRLLFALCLTFCLTFCATACAKESAAGNSGQNADLSVRPSVTSFSDITNDSEAEKTPSDALSPTVSALPVTPDLPAPIVIVLDPGHGGIFSGATYDGRVEKKMTLTVARYVKEYLESNYDNVTVFLTRDTDTDLGKDLALELEQRAIIAKEKEADALISLHFNASDRHNANGAAVYISRRSNVNAPARELATAILNELTALGIAPNGVLTRASDDMFDENGEAYDYYAINRHCANRELVGIIVEHCFMDNATDLPFLATDEALRALASADAKGIAVFFSLHRKNQ